MATTKLNKEGKITVKHFLNTRLKGKPQTDGAIAYPLYIRITVKRQQSEIKSRFTQPIDLQKFDSFLKEYSILLNNEVREITKIVKGLNPFDRQDFNLQVVTSLYGVTTTPLTAVIETCLKDEIRHCIAVNYPKPSLDIDLSNQGEIAVLVQENDLVTLIDWQKSAYTILDLLTTIIPDLRGPLKELVDQYKAAFSFDSLYNTLYATHLYPVKPTLTDWQTGTFKKDIKNEGIVADIDKLLKKHYKA